MGTTVHDILVEYINIVFLGFSLLLMITFTIMAFIFTRVTVAHRRRDKIASVDSILNSGITPGISIVAPAFNEAATIVENIKSLLSLSYDNYEVIVVNDGSSDDTLEKIIRVFHLVPKEGFFPPEKGKAVRAVYRSKNIVSDRLVVVDKENGGKSDALNAGIHFSNNKYVGCIDVDCLLHPNALLHVVRAFYQGEEKRVVAVRSVIRVVNSCKVYEGAVEKVRLPKSWLAKYQLLEYTRSFLLGRMAWGGLDGLLIISGAFGFFERKVLLEIGGYDTNTVGEDMEIIFRIRRHMTEQKTPYTMEYLPEPLCYTEVPEDRRIFINQRDRWARGNIETLKKHRRMFFNPSYGRLGMLSYPYWFFYEWLAPIIEFSGVFIFLVLWYLDAVNWRFFVAITLALYAFATLFSIYAISWDLYNYKQYTSNKNLLALIACAITEPIFFHPLVVYSAIKGNLKQLFKKKSHWGTITRKGFASS